MIQLDLDLFYTPIPKRIARLRDLAYNLWWSWHPQAQELYIQIDSDLWEKVYHNPVSFLHEVRQRRLDQAAGNPAYMCWKPMWYPCFTKGVMQRAYPMSG